MPGQLKKLKIQFGIFLLLFLLAEIVLRCVGMQSGTLIDDFKVEDAPVYQERFISDEVGINHLLPNSESLMYGTVINAQGFRGLYNFTPATVDSVKRSSNKEVVMVIGDSFVEGCCPDSISNSFPDLLARSGNYEVFNFGVSGTDPLQYALITKKYATYLHPDRVVLVFYLGNDILSFNRQATPGLPLMYPFKNNKWIYAIPPNHLSGKLNYVFKNADEAYEFYLQAYTLKGNNRNFTEKLMSYSVLCSKLYLFLEHKLALRRWQKANPGTVRNQNDITYAYLKAISTTLKSANIPLLVVAIPAPKEAEEKEGLVKKYADLFRDIPWNIPFNLLLSDYDGNTTANHLNNSGHKKYLEFLEQELKRTKKD